MRRLAACLLLYSLCAHAGWRADVQPAHLVGEGDLSLFGFRLYQAQLWSQQVPVRYDAPFALHITYARSISRQRFVDTGIDEIKRQASAPLSPQTLAHWRDDMMRGLVDVDPGDRLTAVNLPGKGVRFYAGARETAEIDDPAFARAFFGIWFDPSTRAPGLRKALLGLSK
jgi:hypothetical protein